MTSWRTRTTRSGSATLAPLPYPYERVHAEQFVAESFLSDWKSKPTFAIVLDDSVIGGINLSIDKRHQIGRDGVLDSTKALGERLRNRKRLAPSSTGPSRRFA